MHLAPEDILVTIHIDYGGAVGDLEWTLAQWIANGPPMRLYTHPSTPRLKATGQPLPYEVIPLIYQNTPQARDLIAHGLLADSWSANIATWDQRRQEEYRARKAGLYSPEEMLKSALTGWMESLGEDLFYTPAGKLYREEFPARGRVLDLNCGYGHSSTRLATRGFEVFGVDFSPNLIASAQAMAARSRLALHFQSADPFHLPFPDDWFDAALSLTGYGYLPARSSRLAALDEIYRVLRGGAPLVLSYYVAPEKREEALEGLRHEEQPIQAADDGFSPNTSEEAGRSFVRWLTAQTFQEELSHSRFQMQRFVVEELFHHRGETMGAALLKKPVRLRPASHATDEGREEPTEQP
jgi:SAM-dependent methyltransferase